MTSVTNKPPIRSYVRREGRITKRQRCALQQLWSRYGIDVSQGVLNPQHQFARTTALNMDIGFGMGGSLIEMARNVPQEDFIGVEVYRPGVGALLAELNAAELTNVKVYCADCLEVLRCCIGDQSLQAVYIFFPDPWPKKRHHKRRLVQAAFIELVGQKLGVGGLLHIATDWESYAQEMMVTLTASPLLVNCQATGQFSPRPAYRPLTKFERRGKRLGHGVWDLIFKKH